MSVEEAGEDWRGSGKGMETCAPKWRHVSRHIAPHDREWSWLVGVLEDVVHSFANRGELLGVFVADLEAELLLQ